MLKKANFTQFFRVAFKKIQELRRFRWVIHLEGEELHALFLADVYSTIEPTLKNYFFKYIFLNVNHDKHQWILVISIFLHPPAHLTRTPPFGWFSPEE